jgi:hypothetical protein
VWDGGRTVAGNVVAACYECNHARGGEANQMKRGFKFTIGDDTPTSPFAGLRVLLGLKKLNTLKFFNPSWVCLWWFHPHVEKVDTLKFF